VATRLSDLVPRTFESSPLRNEAFRYFYLGSIGAALGYTMQATISAWLMATLTTSALMVALVQSASTTPTLIFGLIAGTLADIIDRRRVILVTQIVLFTASLLLGVARVAWDRGTGVPAVPDFSRRHWIHVFICRHSRRASTKWSPASSCPTPLRSVRWPSTSHVPSAPALAGAIAASLTPGSALVAGAFFFARCSWRCVAASRATSRYRASPNVFCPAR
jgi:MFS family permease